MSHGYIKRVLRKAGNDTLGFFGWNKKTLALPVFWVVGSLVYWGVAGWSAMMNELLIAVSYGLIPVGAFAVLLFVYNFLAAPARLQAATDHQVEELEGTLNRIRNKQDAVDELSVLLSEGIHTIWNAPVNNDDESVALNAHWCDWHDRVVAYLTAHFNKADVDHFDRLGVLPITTRGNTYTGMDGNDETHRRILMHYALQEQRLREIIRDHNVTHF